LCIFICSLFELTRRETLRKMGKVSKEAVLQKLLQKVIFIRDCDIQKKELDPIVTEEFREQELSISTDKEKLGVSKSDCPNNLPHCRLGCVCVSCPDIYEEFYEKHCRDTGDPDCLHGCICENPGPHLNNGESKWIKSKPYKYKKQRVRVRFNFIFSISKHIVPSLTFNLRRSFRFQFHKIFYSLDD